MSQHLKHPVVAKMRQLAYRHKKKGVISSREKLRNKLKAQGYDPSLIRTALSVYHLHSGGFAKSEEVEKTFGGIRKEKLPTSTQHRQHNMGTTIEIPSSKGHHTVVVTGIDHKNKRYKLQSTKTGKSGHLSFDVAHKIKKPGT
jgi:hypothetical protein